MSREPYVSNRASRSAGVLTAVPGAPYAKPLAIPGSLLRPTGPPRLTVHNFPTFQTRLKKLPPDANAHAAPHAKLYQFSERVCFGCAKCRRDNIQSDSVAIDLANKIMLCTACFSRIVRPRTYRPSRVVPFPSLLSWLNYRPSKVVEVSDDILSRPAEAVAPSGDRMFLPMLASGDRPTSLDKLPAIAMNLVPVAGGSVTASNTTVGNSNRHVEALADGTHPCLRVWGLCQHGPTCLFRRAPADLCLAYLMGLCPGKEDGTCELLHQDIYDLPSTADPTPGPRYPLDLDSADSAWGRWVAKRKTSPNSAEWQLWNNGPLGQLFDVYVPVSKVADEEEAEDVKLNLSDIMSALRGIKQ